MKKSIYIQTIIIVLVFIYPQSAVSSIAEKGKMAPMTEQCRGTTSSSDHATFNNKKRKNREEDDGQHYTRKNDHVVLKRGLTETDYLIPIHWAAQHGDREMIKQLLSSGMVDINSQECGSGKTALHFAVQRGHKAIVNLLIRAGADKDVVDDNGATPLLSAVSKGYEEIVALLLTAGAKTETEGGLNRLHSTLNSQYNSIAKKLLGSSVAKDFLDENSLVPLHKAAYNGNVEIVRMLIEKKANIEVLTRLGRTPLHIAAICGHEKIVTLLIASGARLDEVTQGTHTFTTLHLAVIHNRPEVVKQLLLAGTHINWTTTPSMKLIRWSAEAGNKKIIEMLLLVHKAPLEKTTCFSTQAQSLLEECYETVKARKQLFREDCKSLVHLLESYWIPTVIAKLIIEYYDCIDIQILYL